MRYQLSIIFTIRYNNYNNIIITIDKVNKTSVLSYPTNNVIGRCTMSLAEISRPNIQTSGSPTLAHYQEVQWRLKGLDTHMALM